MLARTSAWPATLRFDPAAPLKARQVPELRVGDRPDVTARPAVAAVRAALRDVLLPPEAEGAVAAASGLDPDARAITDRLRERGVITDFREPDVVRFGLSPLTTSFADVDRGVDALRVLLTSA